MLRRWGGGAGHPHFETSGETAQLWCHSVPVRDENTVVGVHSGSFAAFSDQRPFRVEIWYLMVNVSSELQCGSPSRQAVPALQGLAGFQALEVGARGFGWGWGMGQGLFRCLDGHCHPVPE